MLRITTHSTADSLTFQLEGKLVGPWVTELRDCLSVAQNSRAVLDREILALTDAI